MKTRRMMVGAIALAAMFVAVLEQAQAGIVTFTNRALFDAAAPGLALEDFEVGTAALDVSGVGLSINSTTNAGNISPGEILPGISLSAIEGSSMVSLGSGFGALTSNGIAVNLFANHLRLDLNPAVGAVGFDLTSTGSARLDAQFFNGAVLLGTLQMGINPNGLVFGGAIANGGDVITRVDFVNTNPAGTPTIMDDLAFGNVNHGGEIPEPASLAIFGTVCLIAGVGRRRKRN